MTGNYGKMDHASKNMLYTLNDVTRAKSAIGLELFLKVCN